MRIPQLSPSHSLLSPAQIEEWNRFTQGLAPEQSAWLLGFLTAVNQLQSQGETPPRPTETGSPSITAVYASQTGNASKLAKKFASAAAEAGLQVDTVSASDFKVNRLKSMTDLVLITSTQGQGDPPDTAVEFHRYLLGPRAPKLPNLRYSVLALGDSSYVNFCKVGVDWDKRLAELGATAVVPRVECDVDFDDTAADWTKRTIAEFKSRMGSTAPISVSPAPASATAVEYDKKHPFPAPVLERINLNGRGSEKETLHLELSLSGSGIQYQPGDAIGIVPRNDPAYVDEFIEAAGFSKDASITVDGQDRPLRDALVDVYEVTTITRPFVKAFAAETANAELAALAAPGKDAEFQAFIRGREIIDILLTSPNKGLGPSDMLPMLRRLQPRLYSISSSLLAHEDEVHLTIGVTRYHTHGRNRHGVCSTYLGERLGENEPVRVYPSPNPAFKLPSSPDTPLIMIGPGTGVAPFRSFIEEREAIGAKGRNWLFFGDQHFTTDFLYQTEWQRHLQTGILTRMNVAFSRDQEQKIYVQQRMIEHARDLYEWIQEGAAIYVCGDANRMAEDVHQTLIAIIEKEGAKSREAAEVFIRELHKSKRYQRDVY